MALVDKNGQLVDKSLWNFVDEMSVGQMVFDEKTWNRNFGPELERKKMIAIMRVEMEMGATTLGKTTLGSTTPSITMKSATLSMYGIQHTRRSAH